MYRIYLYRNTRRRHVGFTCDAALAQKHQTLACVESDSAPVICELHNRMRDLAKRPIVNESDTTHHQLFEMANYDKWTERERKVAGDWLSVVFGEQ